MNLNKIINSIKEAFLVSGYSRTAYELLQLSDRQLEDLGISRALLKLGHTAYPWRVEVQAQVIPDNVSQFKAASKYADQMSIIPKTQKAA